MGSNFKIQAGKVLWFMGLIGGIASCETLVGIVPEERVGLSEPQLVVHSYISPSDTLIKVIVSQTSPVFSNLIESRPLDDADVRLRNGSIEVRLTFDEGLQAYIISTKDFVAVQAGQTYHLKVTRGDNVVSASTTVPLAPPPIHSYKIDTSYSSGGLFSDYDTTLAVRFTWKDLPGVGHYYRTSGRALIELAYREIDQLGNVVNKVGRAWVPLTWERGLGRRDIQSDINEDGSIMESPLGRVNLRRPRFVDGVDREYADKPLSVISITLDLLLTDEPYYRYHRSIEQNEDAADNPFAEPSLPYSNLQGGLGVFASFNSFSIDIKP